MALDLLVFEELWFTKEGTYGPRSSAYIGMDGIDGESVMLKFSVPLRPDVPPGKATICVGMSAAQATQLLANLLEAQQRGMIPQFRLPTEREKN